MKPTKLLRNSRTTDSRVAAKSAEFLFCLLPRPAACALLLAGLLLALATGCSPKPEAAPEAEKNCPLTGEVKALDEKNQTATIQHQAICDWMGAMTMEFPVQSTDDFKQLKVGDKITATVNIKGMDYHISAVHKEPAAK